MTNRIQLLEQFCARLENPDIHDPDLFARTIREAHALFNFSDEFLAHKFEMTRTTAMRWRHGTAAPYPMMRRPVYKFLRTQASKALAAEKLVAVGDAPPSIPAR